MRERDKFKINLSSDPTDPIHPRSIWEVIVLLRCLFPPTVFVPRMDYDLESWWWELKRKALQAPPIPPEVAQKHEAWRDVPAPPVRPYGMSVEDYSVRYHENATLMGRKVRMAIDALLSDLEAYERRVVRYRLGNPRLVLEDMCSLYQRTLEWQLTAGYFEEYRSNGHEDRYESELRGHLRPGEAGDARGMYLFRTDIELLGVDPPTVAQSDVSPFEEILWLANGEFLVHTHWDLHSGYLPDPEEIEAHCEEMRPPDGGIPLAFLLYPKPEALLLSPQQLSFEGPEDELPGVVKRMVEASGELEVEVPIFVTCYTAIREPDDLEYCLRTRKADRERILAELRGPWRETVDSLMRALASQDTQPLATSQDLTPATSVPSANRPTEAMLPTPGVTYGYLSSRELAKIHGLNAEALRKRLARWRKTHLDGWIEDPNPKSREARYLYSPAAVADVIQKAKKASGKVSGNRPA